MSADRIPNEDLREYLDKTELFFRSESEKKGQYALLLLNQGYFKSVKMSFEQDDEAGIFITSVLLSTALLSSSKNLDESMTRLKKINERVNLLIAEMDKSINKG